MRPVRPVTNHRPPRSARRRQMNSQNLPRAPSCNDVRPRAAKCCWSRPTRCGALFSHAHLDRIEKVGCRIDELQRLLRLRESQRKARTPVRQLVQSLPFADKDRVRLLDCEFHDALHRAVVAKIGHLFFDRDQIFVARKLVGDLKKFADRRPDTIGVAAGNVRSFRRLNEIAHQALEQGLYFFNFLEVAVAKDATVGDSRRKHQNSEAEDERPYPSAWRADDGSSFPHDFASGGPLRTGRPGSQFPDGGYAHWTNLEIPDHHSLPLRMLLVPGITNLYCGPSFETATSRPPQDEV